MATCPTARHEELLSHNGAPPVLWRGHSCLPSRHSCRDFSERSRIRVEGRLGRDCSVENPCLGVGLGGCPKSVERSLDAADTSVCATSAREGLHFGGPSPRFLAPGFQPAF